MSPDVSWVNIADSNQPFKPGLDSICDIIRDVTGESYTQYTLMDLAFDPLTSMYLTRGDDIRGAMLIDTQNAACWRVIVMVVAADLQRRGHGSTALSRLEELTRGRTVASIILDVRVDNCQAIEFYRRHHFEVDSLRSGFYHGIDGYRMSLTL